jgi:hypothetical protein
LAHSKRGVQSPKTFGLPENAAKSRADLIVTRC